MNLKFENKVEKKMDDVNWNLFLDDDIKLKFNEKTTEIINELNFDSKYDCMNYLNFSKVVMTAATKSAPSNIKSSLGWFILSKGIVKPLLEKSSKVLNLIRQNNFPKEEAINMAKEVKFNLRESIQLAKSKWTENLANKIHDLVNSPIDEWQAVNKLKGWIQDHHKLADIVRLKDKKISFLNLTKKI